MSSTLIEALRNPAIYPHPVDRVTLVETHISRVLLAGDYAYKIKKPLNLGFLDFSTLEQRAYYCQEEIRLNQRHAPKLYLGVVAITGDAHRPRLDGTGEPIEYAVRMRRFAAGDGFDRMLADGGLQRTHILELAAQLAELHRQAAVADPHSRFGRSEQVIAPMRENLAALREVLDTESGRRRLQRLVDWTETRFAALEPSLTRRRRGGFIRECHGDAHLGNVTLFEGRTTLFDCIEFSEDLRWIDVMSDLAFTIMDLRHRGAEGSSWLLLDRYLSLTGDFEGLGMLEFYLVYRALVRAKITGLRLTGGDLDPEQRQAIESELEGYLDLADRTAAGRRPMLLITMGLSGSGKTRLGDSLIESPGLIRLRSDVERKRLFGMAPEAASGSAMTGGIYNTAASRNTYARLLELAERVLRFDLPVLVDATFLKYSQRAAFRDLARRLDVPFRLLACEADEATLRMRITDRATRGSDASEADLGVLDRQLVDREPLTVDELDHALVLDTTADDAAEVVTEWFGALCVNRLILTR